MSKQWMIYGASGYTGRLLVKEAIRQGLRPILAGRNAQRLVELALETGLSCRIFDLTANASSYLQDIFLLLNCAGPFYDTQKPALKACLERGTHYLDISGELNTFEYVYQRHQLWKEHQMVVIPGVGFDVTAGDCLAALLKRHLPDATSFVLGLKIKDSSLSDGSLRSLLHLAALGGRKRDNGLLCPEPLGKSTKLIPFDGRQGSLCVSMPLAELASSWLSTRIPHVETYVAIDAQKLRHLKMLRLVRPLLAVPMLLRWFEKQATSVRKLIAMPPPKDEQKGAGYLWGEATNSFGRSYSLRLSTPEVYRFTCHTSLKFVDAILEGQIKPGAYSPSMALGADFILKLDSVALEAMIGPVTQGS